jgi:hypothetical protein
MRRARDAKFQRSKMNVFRHPGDSKVRGIVNK